MNKCCIVGPHPLRLGTEGGTEHGEFYCTYPTSLLDLCRVGKSSLRRWKTGAHSGVPEPVTRLGLWGSQSLGHPGTTVGSRRAENRVGGLRLAQGGGWVGKGKGSPCLSQCGIVFSLVGSCGTERPPTKRASPWLQMGYCHGGKWIVNLYPPFSGWV